MSKGRPSALDLFQEDCPGPPPPPLRATDQRGHVASSEQKRRPSALDAFQEDLQETSFAESGRSLRGEITGNGESRRSLRGELIHHKTVSQNALKELFQTSRPKSPEKPKFDILTVTQLFQSIDTDLSGTIGSQEFLSFINMNPKFRNMLVRFYKGPSSSRPTTRTNTKNAYNFKAGTPAHGGLASDCDEAMAQLRLENERNAAKKHNTFDNYGLDEDQPTFEEIRRSMRGEILDDPEEEFRKRDGQVQAATDIKRLMRVWKEFGGKGELSLDQFTDLFRKCGLVLEYSEPDCPRDMLATALRNMAERPDMTTDRMLDEVQRMSTRLGCGALVPPVWPGSPTSALSVTSPSISLNSTLTSPFSPSRPTSKVLSASLESIPRSSLKYNSAPGVLGDAPAVFSPAYEEEGLTALSTSPVSPISPVLAARQLITPRGRRRKDLAEAAKFQRANTSEYNRPQHGLIRFPTKPRGGRPPSPGSRTSIVTDQLPEPRRHTSGSYSTTPRVVTTGSLFGDPLRSSATPRVATTGSLSCASARGRTSIVTGEPPEPQRHISGSHIATGSCASAGSRLVTGF